VTVGAISQQLRVAGRRLRRSWVVIAIAAVCVILAAGGDTWRDLGRYDRTALAMGEYWRLVSGHLVHFGWGHLWPNVAALLVIGLLFERTFRTGDWVRSALASAAAIDAGLWWIDTQLEWYVGLSGVLHGLVAAGAFELLLRRPSLFRRPFLLRRLLLLRRPRLMRRHVVGAALALGLAAKLGYEQTFGPVSLTAGAVGGPVVVAAHLYGAAGGLVMAAIVRSIRQRRSRV